MKRLYRLVISGWYPVVLQEDAATQMSPGLLQELYEDCEVNPYDFDDLTLRLERATEADIAKYGEGDAHDEKSPAALRGPE